LRGRLPERFSKPEPTLYFILVVAAFLLAALGQCFLNRRVNEGGAVALFAVAVALALIAYAEPPEDRAKEHELPVSRWDCRGVLTLFVASLPACAASWLLVLRWESLPTAVFLYAWSLALVAGVCSRREGWNLPRPGLFKEHWAELTLVALVLACGLFLRLHRLDYYPPPGGISWNDEAQIGKEAYGIIHHGYRPWQFPVSVYATWLSFLVLGPTVLALRLPFILLGFATLAVFYLLARELFRLPFALAATFLFAVSRWHIAFSRLVLPSTAAMLLEVSTFYLLLRGRRTGGMFNYVLAGLTVSVGLYSHASFRIVPVLVLLLFVAQAWSSWRSPKEESQEGLRAVGRSCQGWLAFLISFILLAVPYAAIVLREPHRAFGERFAAVMPALFGPDRAVHPESLLQSARRALAFFNYRGEAWGAVNLPDLPMLDPWTGVLFVLGLGYCLFYFRRNRHLFYLAWFLITMIGGGVLTVDFRSHRLVGVMPVVFIFAAVFIEGAWAAFRRALSASLDRSFALILLPVLVFAAYTNYYIFFHLQIHAPSVRAEFTREVSAIANYIAALGEGHYFYLFGNHAYYTPGMDFAWMAGEAPGERALDVLDVIPSRRKARNEELVYIFSTPYNVEALADVIHYFYPRSRTETFHGEYDRYTFVAAHVGADEVRSAQGLFGEYYSGHRSSGEPDLVRQDAQLSFDWRSEEPPVAFPFRAEWRGTIFAPQAAAYVFESEAAGRTRIHIDGEALEEGEETYLVKGWHKLRVGYASEEDSGWLQVLWSTPQRGRELVPGEFLSPRDDVNGLLVSVFEGPDWTGQPVHQSIEPVILLLRMPSAWQSAFVPELAGKLYSFDCQGLLNVEKGGHYLFQIVPWNGNATLQIDGEEVAFVTDTRTVLGGGEVELSAGWHDIALRYAYGGGQPSGVQLSWAARGGETRAIPPEALRPPADIAAMTGS